VNRKIVLASRSPRRIQLLRQIGLEVEVRPSDVEEVMDPKLTAPENARELSLKKARAVAGGSDDAVVIGADTIVVVDDVVLGKPADPEDAVRMLSMLSGRTHTVCTGYALVDRPSGREEAGVEQTSVTFRSIPREEIDAYVGTGGPLDKAGAYGIQDDYGAVFVSRIEGCYYTVVGLPLSRVHAALKRFTQR
jgi:septum formation protein